MESSSTDFPSEYFSSECVVQAVKEDFQCLLKKFDACGSLEFPSFALIWSSMKMSMISSGRMTARESRQVWGNYFYLNDSNYFLNCFKLFHVWKILYYKLLLW